MTRERKDTYHDSRSLVGEKLRRFEVPCFFSSDGDFSFSAFCFTLLPALSSFAYTTRGQRFSFFACNKTMAHYRCLCYHKNFISILFCISSSFCDS
jgi:hypothetical protein